VQGETLDYNIKEGQLDLGQDSSGDIAFNVVSAVPIGIGRFALCRWTRLHCFK
jgi:hypothetical protein